MGVRVLDYTSLYISPSLEKNVSTTLPCPTRSLNISASTSVPVASLYVSFASGGRQNLSMTGKDKIFSNLPPFMKESTTLRSFQNKIIYVYFLNIFLSQAQVKLNTFFMELQKFKLSINFIQLHILLLLAVLHLDQHCTETCKKV